MVNPACGTGYDAGRQLGYNEWDIRFVRLLMCLTYPDDRRGRRRGRPRRRERRLGLMGLMGLVGLEGLGLLLATLSHTQEHGNLKLFPLYLYQNLTGFSTIKKSICSIFYIDL